MELQTKPTNCIGVRVARPSLTQFLEWFDNQNGDNSICQTLAIVNAHTLNLAHEDPAFRNTLNSFSLVLNDGAGLELYGKIAREPFFYNFNGTDLFPTLFEHRSHSQKELRVFLLGAKPGVAAAAAKKIESQYPAVRVVGVRDGYSQLPDAAIVEEINSTKPHLLLVALGNPLQEMWIARNRQQLQVGVACGIGALLDFLSETITRAPAWMRSLRLEWFYRLCLEPKRMMKRYVLGNPLFVFRAIIFLFLKGGKIS
jgi:exopolysaccharide biosynthesis WecB/TagA/CpsF family protein